MKQVIRLSESELHNIIDESVRQALNELGDSLQGQYMIGRLHARQDKRGDKQSKMRKDARREAYKNGPQRTTDRVFYKGEDIGIPAGCLQTPYQEGYWDERHLIDMRQGTSDENDVQVKDAKNTIAKNFDFNKNITYGRNYDYE